MWGNYAISKQEYCYLCTIYSNLVIYVCTKIETALRDFFQYKKGGFIPQKGIIGRYIFRNRQQVREEQRNALFRFLRMTEWLDEVKQKAKAEKCPKTTRTALPPSALSAMTSTPCKFIPNPQDAEQILKLLHELIDGQTKPIDIVMPIRAAIEAGVIRRPTWDEFCAEFGVHKLKAKSSFSLYTGDGYRYNTEVFNLTLAKFKSLISEN